MPVTARIAAKLPKNTAAPTMWLACDRGSVGRYRPIQLSGIPGAKPSAMTPPKAMAALSVSGGRTGWWRAIRTKAIVAEDAPIAARTIEAGSFFGDRRRDPVTTRRRRE